MRPFKDEEMGQVGVAQEQRIEAVVSLHWIEVFVKVFRVLFQQDGRCYNEAGLAISK